MHWLLVEAMRPVLMRGMYHWSCASVPGRGGKRVSKYIRRILRDDPKGSKYAGELDIKSYYPSIPIRRLIWALARKIKDKRFLRTVYSILESCGGWPSAITSANGWRTTIWRCWTTISSLCPG